MTKKITSIFVVTAMLFVTCAQPVMAADEIKAVEKEVVSETTTKTVETAKTYKLRDLSSLVSLSSSLSGGGSSGGSGGAAQDMQVADGTKFLPSFQGKHEVSLFSGSLNYSYPIWVPKGRNGMTPSINLTYSNLNSSFAGDAGYGWNFPANSISRIRKKGIDTMYSEDYYMADIMGGSEELIIIDDTNDIYAPKEEGSFNKYTWTGTYWTAKDVQGNAYTFGQNSSARQVDPNDSGRVYKWMLEKIEDTNGNFITFTYTENGEELYPDSIRYTGFDTNNGIFEVEFVYKNRDPFYSYVTGFQVTHAKIIDEINLISYATGSPVTLLTYEFEHTKYNNAIYLLDEINVTDGTNYLPSTEFDYFDGTEAATYKKINGLYKITDPYGGTHEFTYKPASLYREQNGTSSNPIPFTVYTVYEDKATPVAGGSTYTTTFDYRDGHYYFDQASVYSREYAGFGKVTVTDPADNVHKYYFHQSENDPNNTSDDDIGEYQDHISKKGRVYREEQYDDDDNLLKAVISKWDKDTLTDDDSEFDRFFAYLVRATTIDYGENSQSKTKAVTYDYDSYGNPTEVIDYGEVTLSNQNGDFSDTGTDKITQTTEYIYDTTNHLLSYPKLVEREDQSSNLISRQKLYYDELTYGNIDEGNLTSREDYKDASNYVTTQWEYNTRGMVVTTTNPRNYDTDVTYDAHYLYPATVTNAKSQVTYFTYDPFFGMVTETTDPNGFTKQTVLDSFGRVDEQKVENDSSTMVTVQEFDYDLTNTPKSVTETLYPGNTDTSSNAIAITKKTYYDGFKRPIQVKKEMEGASAYVMTTMTYDSVGNVDKEYLPKTTSSLSYEAPGGADPKTTYTYDALKRVKTAVNSEGTTESTYNDWEVRVEDANDEIKDYLYDARSNLIGVKEYLNSTPYTTDYTYDLNGNLTKIEDADGNEKEMTYDFLGRKLSEELLHDSSENNPNSYSFTYDANGNLASQTDAKSQTINYTYDQLDRVLTENTTETTYTYDTATNGIGRLDTVTSAGGSKSYDYDLRGYITDESKVINSVTYNTEFEYDLLGNILTITYPDTSATEIDYGYNNAGQIEEITDYVDDFDYSPIGTTAYIEFANGITTTNTYDPAHLYRLTDKVTTDGVDNLQDISYTFDPVGNITAIDDDSDTDAGKDAAYVYDDLHRLTSATITNAADSNNYTRTYTYTITGNINTKSDVGTYVYNNIHPHAVTSDGTKTYTYDSNGSLTGDGTWTHTYDTRNRLTQSADGSSTITYTYDEGRTRLTKSDGTSTTTYVNDYFEKEGALERIFIYANNLKVAGIIDGDDVFYHEDHLSGSNISTDDLGDQLELNDYYPYGDQRIEDRAVGYENDYLFTGQERDEETDLYYYGARYYDSVLGRFTSVDPLVLDQPKETSKVRKDILSNPQLLNAYSYTSNNPLKYNDPTGEGAENMAGFGRMLDGGLTVFVGYLANQCKPQATIGPTAVVIKGTGDIMSGFVLSTTGEEPQPNNDPDEARIVEATQNALDIADIASIRSTGDLALEAVTSSGFFEDTLRSYGEGVEKAGEAFGDMIRDKFYSSDDSNQQESEDFDKMVHERIEFEKNDE